MKNIFAITFGTSDVQFNQDVVERHGFIITQNGNIFVLKHREKNIEISLRPNRDRQNYYLLSSPRIDGEKVYNHIADFLPVIELPLTLPVIKQIRKTYPELIIDCWFLVDTNQDKEKVKEQHWKNDTLFVSRIFKAKLQYVFPDEKDEKFKYHTITEELTNIDKQYLDFRRKCPYIFDLKEEEINQIFLLPQGGIDQINHALTLQLIKSYGSKVKLYQQAEDQEPKELKFTTYFLNDLAKLQIVSLIKNGQYEGASMICKNYLNNASFCSCFDFFSLRKLCLFEDAKAKANNLKKDLKKLDFIRHFSEQYANIQNDVFSNSPGKFLFKSIERFYVAEFYFNIKNYTDFTLAFQIFFESFVNYYLNQMNNLDLENKFDEAGKKLLEDLKNTEPQVYEKFVKMIKPEASSKGRSKKDILMPTFPVLTLCANYFAEKNGHTSINNMLKIIFEINSNLNGSKRGFGIDILRNKIAHKGIGVKLRDLFSATASRTNADHESIWLNYLNTIKNAFGISELINPYLEFNEFVEHSI